MDKELLIHIEQKLKEWDIQQYAIEDNELIVSASDLSGLQVHLSLKESNIDFYYSIRTSSWSYNGERTDLHDIISVSFSYFLKFADLKISCSLINVVNPAVTGLEDEIYARYVVPIQYSLPNYKTKNDIKAYHENLILAMFMFEDLFFRLIFQFDIKIKAKEITFSYKLTDDFTNSIKGCFDEQALLNTSIRNFPNWEYAGDTSKGLSIIKSNEVTFYFSIFAESLDENNLLNGINGKLFITNEYKNFISSSNIEEVIPVFEKFNDQLEYIYPLENKVICVGKTITIFIDSFCDFQSFKNEKEAIKQRHSKEFKILFPPEKFIWSDRINDDRFELLIKTLLERQEEIKWTRRIGHVNESDGGRDLIAEWSTKPTGKESRIRDEELIKNKRIIIQCKAYKKGVGKSDVIDIRDTIEHNDCDGYFLAVSSYLKRSLTEHLEKMRYSGNYWIDWWTRDEIESKLIENIDIAKRFEDIVTIKN